MAADSNFAFKNCG